MKPATTQAMQGLQREVESTLDFEKLVEFHRPRIFRFALASLRDRDAAETIAQDCFVRAHSACRKFRGECSLQTWLMGIAANLIRDHQRNRRFRFWKRAQALSLPDSILESLEPSATSPEKLASLKQQIEFVWNATAELSERQRTVFLMRFVEDMDILEIAAATGISEGSVKTHLFRALQSVRLRLEAVK